MASARRTGPDAVPGSELETALSQAIGSTAGPGAAIGIVQDGQLRRSAVRGLASLEHQTAITTDTPFHVASVSKQFTAYCIAQLASRGVIDLTAGVRTYLEWFPFADITVEHLVHHTSGLRDQWAMAGLRGWRWEDTITTADIVRLVADDRELNFTPGTGHAYSNTGYTVLAEVVRAVTGTDLSDYCRELIFDPLGMTSTQFVGDHHVVIPGKAESYRTDGDTGFRRIPLAYSTVGATNLTTTVRDLARWATHAMTPEVSGMLQRRGRLADGTLLDYAFGVLVERHDEAGLTLSHSGGDAGFHAYLYLVPSRGTAGIGMSNLSSFLPGAAVRAAVHRALADTNADTNADATRAASTRTVIADAPESTPAGTADSPPARTEDGARASTGARFEHADLAGWYLNDADTACQLALDEGSLRLRLAHIDVPLTPTGAHSFQDRDGYGLVVTALAQQQISVRLSADGPTQVYTRLPAARRQPESGSFYSPELDIVVHVHRVDDQPLLRSAAWGDVPLQVVADGLCLAHPPAEPFPLVVSVRFHPDGSGLAIGNSRVGRVQFTRIALPSVPRSVHL